MNVLNDTEEVPTLVELFSHPSTILDFDSLSWDFTGASITYFDQTGDAVLEVSESEDIIVKVNIPHTLGTILLADINGFVWVERDQSTINPFYLSTSKDWTDPNSPIKPSDTLATGNNSLVEVITINNLVTFIFQTEKDNIQSGVNYNFYGRLYDPK